MNLPISDKNEISNLLPQKEPMLMVETLLHHTPTTAEVSLTIPDDNIFLENDTFLESGLIEHIAQSIALHKGYTNFILQKSTPMGYIGAIKNLQLYQLPKVGDVIHTHINIINEFMDVTLVAAKTYREGVLIAECEMKTVLAPQ